MFLGSIAPELLEPPVTVLRASLHPKGLAPHIVNLGEWRSHLLTRLRRQLAKTDDDRLRDLYAELSDLPGDLSDSPRDPPGEGSLLMPMRYRIGDRVLSFITTTAVFGTPHDVTLSEILLNGFAEFAKGNVGILRTLLREDFIEHSPGNPSGRDAFTDFIANSPVARARLDLRRAVADEEYVILHYQMTRPDDERDEAVVDIWRLENGLIVEHWDVKKSHPRIRRPTACCSAAEHLEGSPARSAA